MNERQVRIVSFVLLIGLTIIAYWLFVAFPQDLTLRDFDAYYQAAVRFAANQNIYSVEVSSGAIVSSTYIYPPFLALFISKFSFLSYNTVKYVWCLLGFVALFFTAYGITLLTEQSNLKKQDFVARLTCVWFFMLCFEPVFSGVKEGQVNSVILFLLVYYILCLLKEKYIWAGIFLAIATAIKMSPLILLLIVIRFKHWRLLISFTASFLLLILFLVQGSDFTTYGNFFSSFSTLSSGEMHAHHLANFAVGKVLKDLCATNLICSVTHILVIGLLLLTPLIAIWRINDNTTLSELRGIGILICFMIVLSPTFWFHHLSWALIPLAILCLRDFVNEQEQNRNRLIIAIIFFLISQFGLIHLLVLQNFPSYLAFSALFINMLVLCPALMLWKWDRESSSIGT